MREMRKVEKIFGRRADVQEELADEVRPGGGKSPAVVSVVRVRAGQASTPRVPIAAFVCLRSIWGCVLWVLRVDSVSFREYQALGP